ncbi:MAG: hypothetical protein JWM43_170 [Acidobacteriaceae bacterium]|nr:hypothetical protein [Acidobacteriaceae bacterium]
MAWRDRLYLTVSVVLASVPFVVTWFFLTRRKTEVLVTGWRYRLSIAGLVLALIAAIPTPVFFFALELPWSTKGQWVPLGAAWSMPVALLAGVVGLVLLGFAQGRARWMGITTTFLSVALLYVTILGLSD